MRWSIDAESINTDQNHQDLLKKLIKKWRIRKLWETNSRFIRKLRHFLNGGLVLEQRHEQQVIIFAQIKAVMTIVRIE